MDIKVNINITTKQYIFEDKSVSTTNQITETITYELIINLSSISTNDLIKIFIQWLI